MNYPNSVPGVGLVGGKFTDGNPLLGQPASLDPSAWANQVTDELLNVIAAAGIAPSEVASNQLLLALRAAGVFTTPAQFDTSTKAATMEALQRALGNRAGQISRNSAGTLAAIDVGKTVNLISGATSTTLPPLSAVPVGGSFEFICTGQPGAIVQRNGTDSISANGSLQTSFTLDLGDTLTVVSGGTLWLVTGGTAALKYVATFAAALTGNGYQKLPSGLIIQWGQQGVVGSTTTTYSFPIAFPNAALHVIASTGVPGSSGGVNADVVSAAQYKLQNLFSGTEQKHWFAIGY